MCPSHRVAEADTPRLPKANKALIEGVMDLNNSFQTQRPNQGGLSCVTKQGSQHLSFLNGLALFPLFIFFKNSDPFTRYPVDGERDVSERAAGLRQSKIVLHEPCGSALGLLEGVIDDKPATLVSRLKLEPDKSISSAPGLSRRPRENLTESTGTADLRATGGGEAGDAADTVSMSAAANAGRAEQFRAMAEPLARFLRARLASQAGKVRHSDTFETRCGYYTIRPVPSNDVRIAETLPDGAIIRSWCTVWSPVHSPKSPQPSGLCRRASQRAPSSGFANA
ncbi:predicted protein [Postia placenta Mad-698-R]|nr:predicted protein [Postia placenta Mad-698-R]